MKTKKFLTAFAILLIVITAGCKKDTFVEVEGVCPLVISTIPANEAVNVPINTTITATFNENMNPATFTPVTFSVQSSLKSAIKGTNKSVASNVPGTISYDNATKTAIFEPTELLVADVTYTCKLTQGIKDQAGNALQGDYVWTFSTGTIIVPEVPYVKCSDPDDGFTNVVLNKVVSSCFSMPMNGATVTAATFTLYNGLIKVDGAVTFANEVAYFTPTNLLLAGTTYTATLTTGVQNTLGTPLAADFVWSFTTGSLVAPTITLTDPADLATNVALNKVISATFSEAMNTASITDLTFTLATSGGVLVLGTVDLDINGTIATFTPSANLLSGDTYTATITTGAENLAGTPIAADFIWSFSTIPLVAPTVTLTDPADLATDVALNKVISATFSEAMNTASITDLTFTLATSGGVSVLGTVDLDINGTIATFTPATNLLSDSTYTATITTGAESMATGSGLALDYVWHFSTIAHAGPLRPDLLSVARFGIISGVGVTNAAGASVINNLDVGIYPGARSSIVGFLAVDGGPGIINNGDFYAADDAAPTPAMLLQAKNDLVAAYLFAEAATDPAPASVAGDIGGTTLAPGIYKSTSTLLIQSGDLTLDAQGDVNAVWIFQIASDFTTVGGGPFPSPTGGNVILSGGAQARNVYWQVGISAVIGDYTSFKGNILALTSITMNAYSVAEGRMLCQNGAIVLTSTNIINKP